MFELERRVWQRGERRTYQDDAISVCETLDRFFHGRFGDRAFDLVVRLSRSADSPEKVIRQCSVHGNALSLKLQNIFSELF